MSDEAAQCSGFQTTPIEKLADLYATLIALAAEDVQASDALIWAIRGIESAVRTGASLDEALGLKAVGRRSVAQQLDTVNRDMHLLAALASMSVDVRVSEWELCQRLAARIRSFALLKWARHCREASPPEGWPEWERHVFMAAKLAPGSTATDAKLPTSPSRLFEIARSNPHYSPSHASVKLLAQQREYQ
ncbi:hypothetical protein C380_06375 [Acidovorax sp. KKS102]|uniref:hypothetical protein n=1 Tax=Acidovorax sp. KKS102 TaxID=358220 RepID=UPI00028B2555|nr:hypothetical protein [Acidovorax sp. KKS102]AFU44985.1 hypothetical protein C380_06375 [Acidovorax sp. KKS102]